MSTKIPREWLTILDDLARRQGVSRQELLRRAVEEALAPFQPQSAPAAREQRDRTSTGGHRARREPG